ncbi:MAG: hypothetical protein LBD94_03220 [Rickettsiales bacterium]|nr:hypothetical protein [Rickettsiales bacterium]
MVGVWRIYRISHAISFVIAAKLQPPRFYPGGLRKDKNMRLFTSLCMAGLLLTNGAFAYKLCMAQHVKPTSCTKSGDFDSWVMTCTGGTISKMQGHCEIQLTASVPNSSSECINDYKEKTYIYSCYLDVAVSNGQLIPFNTHLFAGGFETCGDITDNTALWKIMIFPIIDLDLILKRILL